MTCHHPRDSRSPLCPECRKSLTPDEAHYLSLLVECKAQNLAVVTDPPSSVTAARARELRELVGLEGSKMVQDSMFETGGQRTIEAL